MQEIDITGEQSKYGDCIRNCNNELELHMFGKRLLLGNDVEDQELVCILLMTK